MGWMDEYNKALRKLKEEEELKKADNTTAKKNTTTKKSTTTKSTASSSKSKSNDSFMDRYYGELARLQVEEPNIAPVSERITSRVTTPIKSTKKNDTKWFQKGAFEDGYDFGDVTKTILGIDEDSASLKDLTWNSAKRGYYNARYGEESFKAMDGLANDKEAYEKILAGEEYQFAPGNKFAEGVSGAFELIGQQARQFTNPTTLAMTGGAAGAAFIAGQAGPQVLVPEEVISVPSAAIAGFTAGSAAANFQIEAGHAYNEMLEAGISEKTAKRVATAVGGVNAGLELLQVDELVDAYRVTKASGTTKSFAKKILDELVARGVDVAKETAQEVAQEGVTVAGVQAASKLDKGEWAYNAEDVKNRLIDTAESSALSFGLMNVPAAAKNTVAIAKEQKQTKWARETEKKVADKVYEDLIAEAEKDGKLSAKEKSDIRNKVMNDLEKGNISTDVIENLFDEEGYKAFQAEKDNFFKSDLKKSYDDALINEKEQLKQLKQQLDELIDDPNPAYAERYDSIVSQITELQNNPQSANLRAQLDQEVKRINEMKGQLHDKVQDMVKGTKLEESYNELIRSNQKYTPNMAKYTDEHAKKTIENIMNSGMGDNTNHFHEYADWLAQISADKGMSFSLTNNAELKGTEHDYSAEGLITNGYKTADGIVLNMDSPKALNSTVGHEITHVLEQNTELYQALQEKIFSYEIAKNGQEAFDKRLNDTIQRYKGKDADAKAELTADLIGDYLFTDYDFVHNLSAENRNIFEKIYDEIKYLCKVVTAGSKEARELEKVKKAFEDAYRANAKNTAISGVKYSLMEYSEQQKQNWATSKRIVIYDNPQQLSQFIQDSVANKTLDKKMYFGAIPSDLANRIHADTGVNVENYNLSLSSYEIRKILKDHGSEATEAPRGQRAVGEDDFAHIVDVVLNPTSVALSENTYMGKPAIVFTGEHNGRMNVIAVVSDKRLDLFVQTVYVNAKKGNLSMPTGEQAPINTPEANNGTVSTTKVAQNGKDVKHSLSDSTGKQLTNEQADFFKDSKIRDENGNLKVMYHGSPEAFTVFDKKKAKSSGYYGRGFYFTDSDSHAKQYGNTYETYLNITNPLQDGTNDITKEQLRKFVEAIAENEDYGIDNYGYDATVDSVTDSVYGKSDFAMLMDINASCVGNMVEAIELFNEVNGTDYNGIIAPTETVAFYPEQIKSVTNQNPTDNPNIHRSLSNTGEKPKQYGDWNVYGSDFGYKGDFAPSIPTPNRDSVLPGKRQSVEEMFPDEPDAAQSEHDNLVEVRDATEARMYEMAEKAEWDNPDFAAEFEKVNAEWVEASNRILELEEELSARDGGRLDSLTDADAPPEMDAPVYSKTESATNPFSDRDWHEVGKNRSTKAFIRENPEFKPFFQEEAMTMLYDLGDTQKAERWYNDKLHYESGGELGFGGQKRLTSDDIAQLLDEWGLSYAQIQEGLTAIAEDNDKVNNMPAKRIEFKLNERLMNGYKDFHTGKMVEPNQAYLDMIRQWQYNQQASENFDSFMETADQYAPDDIAPVVKNATTEATVSKTENIAPVKPVKKPSAKPATKTQQKPNVAKVLTAEPKAEKKSSKAWSWAKEHLLDNGMVFEDLSKKTGNRRLEAKWNFIRNSEARAQRLIGKGANGVKALNDIRKQVEKSGKTDKFFTYLYHVHNIDRMTLADRFKGTPNKAVFGDTVTADISKKEAERLLKQNPEFKKWSNDVYKFNKHLRKLLVDGGVISQEVANLWEKMYPHYVPIRRAGDNGLNINVPLDTNKTGVNAPVKRATGGSRDILPLFDTMAQRTIQTYKAISKNNFGVELKNMLGSTIANEAQTVDGIIESLDSEEGLLKKGENGMSPTFTVFENGQRVEFAITEEMYAAMKPKSDIASYNNKVLNGISNFRRGTLTEYNPWFLLKNAIKDQQDVLINSQHPLKTYANMPVAIAEMIGGGEYYQEYLENGGEQNTYFDDESNTFEKNKAWEAIKWATGLNEIAWANNKIEMLPRLAEYMASRKAGRSVEVSMLDAARVTTNFAAGGDVTKLFNRNGATFLNASVQGAVQQARNIREAKMNGLKGWVGLAARYLAAGLPVVLLNNLIWEDDEEYEELADYVKRDYYIVPKFLIPKSLRDNFDDGRFLRIPKGRTVAVIQDAFEQMDNLRTGDDEVDLKSFLELAVSNLAPNNPLDNNIFSPIIQVAQNKTWYGEDLVPSRLQDVPEAEQYDESTDEISRWLGEKLDYSPVKINYLLDQYSGVIGDTFLPMLTPEAESGDDTTLGTMTAPLRDMFTTDSVINNKTVGDFYDLKDQIDINANSSKATENDQMKAMYMDAVGWELSDLYKQKREIQNSNLADSAKYKQSRDIQKQINEIMENAMGGYENVNVNGLYSEVGDKRFNQDAESGKWYEIKPKNSDGTANWYYEKEQEVTKGLGISYGEYWNNREEYNYAYDNPEKYTVAKAMGGYTAFRSYTSDMYDIKADKDENGKSISGSRKEKVIDYINEMDADYGEKIILFKSEYPADDTYNEEIIDYLNSRDDISYEEMETILKYLGFNVDSNGNITW